nr:MAG TPA: hypothetical protein [Caudoviricetes sp.]
MCVPSRFDGPTGRQSVRRSVGCRRAQPAPSDGEGTRTAQQSGTAA